MTEKIKNILKFFKTANKLKITRRYKNTLKQGGDSTAEHSWSLALLVLLVGEHYKKGINIDHALKLALVHDLPESMTDDVDAYDQITGKFPKALKFLKEHAAMKDIADDGAFGQKVYKLWKEYAENKTKEAKLVKALDKIEAFIHLSEGNIDHYKQKEFFADYADEIIQSFDETVKIYPVLSELLKILKNILRAQLDELGVEWKGINANLVANKQK